MARSWTINGRFLTQPVTGVQRYAREIVRALDRLIGEKHDLTRGLDVELAVPRGFGHETSFLSNIGVRIVGRVGGHVWEQAVLPATLRGGTGLVSLCNTGPLSVRRQIVCIHDLNFRTCPTSYSVPFRILYSFLVPLLGRTSLMVATVSKHSADDLVRHGVVPADRVAVLPNGHEHALRWIPRHSAETSRASGPSTVVLLGSAAAHKNARLILGMVERLASAGFRIAVVGQSSPAVFARQAGPPLDAANLTWLGRLDDGELAALLRDSLCLAFPSLTEGFGLPPLEAMAIGCPSVVSDRASLPEVCGDAALYAPPTDADRWLNQFERLRADPSLRTELVRRGKARIGLFSWQRSAELYLEAMALADGVPAGAARDYAPTPSRRSAVPQPLRPRPACPGQG